MLDLAEILPKMAKISPDLGRFAIFSRRISSVFHLFSSDFLLFFIFSSQIIVVFQIFSLNPIRPTSIEALTNPILFSSRSAMG